MGKRNASVRALVCTWAMLAAPVAFGQVSYQYRFAVGSYCG